MEEKISIQRRKISGAAALAVLAIQFGATSKAAARTGGSDTAPAIGSGRTALSPVKQIKAGLLNVGFVEEGPSNGSVVILLHGWPYDIHSFVDVAPRLGKAGYRVIIPYLRGHGTTTFLDAATMRNAQQAAVALDIIALMDALKIEKAILAGFDWGARTANIVAALWPERCKAMVSVNGYLINNRDRNKVPLPPKLEHGWWYQFYFATERGRAGYEAHRREFNKLMWRANSPQWNFDDPTFERTASAFDNADHVAIVMHNYRWRLKLADGEAVYDALENRLAAGPVIAVPTITLDGDADGVVPATDGHSYASKFSGKRVHRIVSGAGHNLPQEAPEAFVNAILEVDRF